MIFPIRYLVDIGARITQIWCTFIRKTFELCLITASVNPCIDVSRLVLPIERTVIGELNGFRLIIPCTAIGVVRYLSRIPSVKACERRHTNALTQFRRPTVIITGDDYIVAWLISELEAEYNIIDDIISRHHQVLSSRHIGCRMSQIHDAGTGSSLNNR